MIFWTIWAGAAFGMLLVESLIEIKSARKGFHGANGMFIFAAAYIVALTSPVLFIVTWIVNDFIDALIVCAVGGALYAVVFRCVIAVVARLGAPAKEPSKFNNR